MCPYIDQNNLNDEKKGHGANLFTALSLTVISIVCFALVDNTDLPVIGATRDSLGGSFYIHSKGYWTDGQEDWR